MWGEPCPRTSSGSSGRISTHSPRVGRTRRFPHMLCRRLHFNSLAPCGANRLEKCFGFQCVADFNSLAPCGANLSRSLTLTSCFGFQLTRPVWGEPLSTDTSTRVSFISTHSPRVGRTYFVNTKKIKERHFNSLAPCGANPPCPSGNGGYPKFQLTRPVWGEPVVNFPSFIAGFISTHSPRVGRTASSAASRSLPADFNSLAPCGANHAERADQRDRDQFQLTRPVWGEPASVTLQKPLKSNFNSLAPCGANLYILYICRLFAATWGGQ